MFNKSIAYRLSIYISTAVVIVFIAFMAISYLFNSRKINENIENEAKGLASNVIMQVDRQLGSTRELAQTIAEQFVFYGQHENPELLISGIMEKHPYFNAVHVNIDSTVPNLRYTNYFGFRNQDTILLEKDNERIFQCAHVETTFMEISKTKVAGWSAVFRCPRSKNIAVAYYCPIVEKDRTTDRIIGEVICELSLNDLNATINNLEIGKDGYAVLLSKAGQYLAHPKEEWIFERTVETLPAKLVDIDKSEITEALEKGYTGSFIAYPEYRDYEKHWTYYTQLNEIEWTLAFLFPHKELFTPLYLSILTMLFFSVLGTLVIYLIITYITNRLIEPLSTITSQLKRYTSLGAKQKNKTSNEVKLVSESLNDIVSWYEKFKIDKTKEEVLSKRRKQDLLQASEIQQSLIKTNFSEFDKIKEIDIYAIYQPAKIVSGDLFDYSFIDDNNLLITMGDVSGKGVPAALFMSVAQTLIKTNATSLVARRIVTKANDQLFTINQHQFFLTLFLGVLNIKTGVLSYCNAAHTPTYILKLNGEIVELSQSHGLPLGVYSNKKYADSKMTLESGDIIILYTDGITDLQDENKVQFGSDRFIENLRHLIESNPKDIVLRIDKSLKIFRGEVPQIDDITLMAIKYKA